MADKDYIDFVHAILLVEGKNPDSYRADDINKAADDAAKINDSAGIKQITQALNEVEPQDRDYTTAKFIDNPAFKFYYTKHKDIIDNFFKTIDGMKPNETAPGLPPNAPAPGMPPAAPPPAANKGPTEISLKDPNQDSKAHVDFKLVNGKITATLFKDDKTALYSHTINSKTPNDLQVIQDFWDKTSDDNKKAMFTGALDEKKGQNFFENTVMSGIKDAIQKQPGQQVPTGGPTVISVDNQPDLPHLQFAYDKGTLVASLVNPDGQTYTGNDNKPVTWTSHSVNPDLLKKHLQGIETQEARWAFINNMMDSNDPSSLLKNFVEGRLNEKPGQYNLPPETDDQKKEWARTNPQNNTPEMNTRRDKAADGLMAQLKESVGDKAIAGLTNDNIKSAFVNDDDGISLMEKLAPQLQKQNNDSFYAEWKKGITPTNGRGDVAAQERLLKAHQIATAVQSYAKTDDSGSTEIYDKSQAALNSMKQSALANGNTDLAKTLATAAGLVEAYKNGATSSDLDSAGTKSRDIQIKAESGCNAPAAAGPTNSQKKPPDGQSPPDPQKPAAGAAPPGSQAPANNKSDTVTIDGETFSKADVEGTSPTPAPAGNPTNANKNGLLRDGGRKLNPDDKITHNIHYDLKSNYTTVDLNNAELARVTPTNPQKGTQTTQTATAPASSPAAAPASPAQPPTTPPTQQQQYADYQAKMAAYYAQYYPGYSQQVPSGPYYGGYYPTMNHDSPGYTKFGGVHITDAPSVSGSSVPTNHNATSIPGSSVKPITNAAHKP